MAHSVPRKIIYSEQSRDMRDTATWTIVFMIRYLNLKFQNYVSYAKFEKIRQKNITILNVTYKFFITYLQTHRYATFITLQIPTVNLRLEEIHILFTALWYGIEWLATFRFDGNSGLSVDVLSCQNKEQGNNVLQLAILMPFPQYL
jgi:hypothetical protein